MTGCFKEVIDEMKRGGCSALLVLMRHGSTRTRAFWVSWTRKSRFHLGLSLATEPEGSPVAGCCSLERCAVAAQMALTSSKHQLQSWHGIHGPCGFIGGCVKVCPRSRCASQLSCLASCVHPWSCSFVGIPSRPGFVPLSLIKLQLRLQGRHR